MKLTYIGTAAAEAIPAMFCECSFCELVRKNGGKDVRRRSGALVDDSLMIDFSADINTGAYALGIRLSKVKNIIFTHSHNDHFSMHELGYRRSPAYCMFKEEKELLHLYGNRKIEQLLHEAHGGDLTHHGFDFTFIEPYKTVKIGDYTVTPLSVNHCRPEDAYIYLIEKDGVRLLYAHDTGMIIDETFEYLKGIALDIVSLDCTLGSSERDIGHMGFPANLKTKRVLEEYGCVKDGTVFVSNHFSHNGLREPDGPWTYDRFSEMAAKNGFLMSYDGMTVEK